MRGIGVIVNPRARGNRRVAARTGRFRALLGADDDVRAPQDECQLMAALGDFHARQFDTLAVCGGDGSVSYVMTRALRVWNDGHLPRFLLLRGGTMNNLARSLGKHRRSPEAVLAAVVEARKAGETLDTVELDLMRVNGREYGYTVGAGMIVRFLTLYYEARRPGPAVALWLLARLGLSYFLHTSMIARVAQPIAAEVMCDAEKLPFSAYTLLLASTIPHLGLGARPFYRAGSAGRFHLLAGESDPGELLRGLPKFYVGRAASLLGLYDVSATRVRIEFAEPQRITVNGDVPVVPVNVLEIEAGPRVTLLRC